MGGSELDYPDEFSRQMVSKEASDYLATRVRPLESNGRCVVMETFRPTRQWCSHTFAVHGTAFSHAGGVNILIDIARFDMQYGDAL